MKKGIVFLVVVFALGALPALADEGNPAIEPRPCGSCGPCEICTIDYTPRNRAACYWQTRHAPRAPEALPPGTYCLQTVALAWARTEDGCALIAYPVVGECEGGE